MSVTVSYAFPGGSGRYAKTIVGRILCLAVSIVLYGLCEGHKRLEPLAYSTISPHLESMAIGAGGDHLRGNLLKAIRMVISSIFVFGGLCHVSRKDIVSAPGFVYDIPENSTRI